MKQFKLSMTYCSVGVVMELEICYLYPWNMTQSSCGSLILPQENFTLVFTGILVGNVQVILYLHWYLPYMQDHSTLNILMPDQALNTSTAHVAM